MFIISFIKNNFKNNLLLCKKLFSDISDISRDFLGDQFQKGVGREGVVMPPYGSRAKSWWGPGSKVSRSSKDLVY